MLFTMKKILSFSTAKILLFCSIGLFSTLGAFWHHQSNQHQLNQMNILNQGIGTCFNRISQTFTAMMIKDIQSPYLNRGFMGLSDECLNETMKGINPFKQNVGKGYQALNKLISEVHWFHESISRLHSPMLSKNELNPSLNPISSKFGQMENLKVTLIDEIEATNSLLREVQRNDEVVMGLGLILFVIGISVLGMKELNNIQLRREIENQALNLLKAGQTNVGGLVDNLVLRGLNSQGLVVSGQVFKDYHAEILERLAMQGKVYQETVNETNLIPPTPSVTEIVEAPELNIYKGPKTSFKEVLVNLQNIMTDDLIQLTDIRDVELAVNTESFEQLMNAALNKLASVRHNQKKILISNQVHADKSVITLFLGAHTFTATELEFAHTHQNATGDGIDMNMMILKEMASEINTQWYFENKTDRSGAITGMLIRFTVNRVPKDAKSNKNLVSVVKGKKKDISRELMN